MKPGTFVSSAQFVSGTLHFAILLLGERRIVCNPYAIWSQRYRLRPTGFQFTSVNLGDLVIEQENSIFVLRYLGSLLLNLASSRAACEQFLDSCLVLLLF